MTLSHSPITFPFLIFSLCSSVAQLCCQFGSFFIICRHIKRQIAVSFRKKGNYNKMLCHILMVSVGRRHVNSLSLCMHVCKRLSVHISSGLKKQKIRESTNLICFRIWGGPVHHCYSKHDIIFNLVCWFKEHQILQPIWDVTLLLLLTAGDMVVAHEIICFSSDQNKQQYVSFFIQN